MSDITLGIIGGGQLGSMLAISAKKLNIKTVIYCDDLDAPAQNFCNEFISGSYSDKKKITKFVNLVDYVTYEFENIPFETLSEINKLKPVLPKPSVNRLIQHRLAEKDFVNKLNIRTTRYASVENESEIDALEDLSLLEGNDYTRELIKQFLEHVENKGFLPDGFNILPFENSINQYEESSYPGDWDVEEKIRHYIRWNALVTVLKANKELDLGGHISTYSSASTLYEVGFNHFFRGGKLSDMVYYQGHSSPGIYARSFLEGNISSKQLDNFRQEIDGEGLSSYPHPWLMPEYWQFPTVSMGLGPIMSIYQAHVMKYLEQRNLLKNIPNRKIWMFCGDGEMDEPESMGSISLAAREKLDNLVFVINCNLQRLDGPVRGNSRIITELGSIFKAAGWNVVNLIWGRKWNDLIARDKTGALRWVMNNTVDGEYQNFKAKGGAYTRKHFFGKHPDALKLVENITDKEIENLNRGGHDPLKVFNAYKSAYDCTDKPTVILAFTVKGYGIGSRQADNTTHQVKKLSEENLKDFIKNFNLPIDAQKLKKLDYLEFNKSSKEYKYLVKQRQKLGGFLPKREPTKLKLQVNYIFDY